MSADVKPREAFDIAPRVTVFSYGSRLPSLEPGTLALAQLVPDAGSPAVFGDGTHPTTRLCAAAVDFICRRQQPAAVLDVGTGTGVLARIARARGVPFVVGTDVDPAALQCAGTHADLDESPGGILFSDHAPDHWGARFDLVVANILERPLFELAPAMARAIVPGGVLLLSGFTCPQVPALRVCYEKLGFTFTSQTRCEQWVLLRFACT